MLSQFGIIKETCPHIALAGLMTIGSVEQSHRTEGKNQDFVLLFEIRETLEKIHETPLELSIGMSDDFEEAVYSASLFTFVSHAWFRLRLEALISAWERSFSVLESNKQFPQNRPKAQGTAKG